MIARLASEINPPRCSLTFLVSSRQAFRVFALAKFVGSCVEGPQWRDTSGKMPLSSLTMESDATNGIPEGLAICQSPMCNVRFEQTGMKVKPRCYCSDECKWNCVGVPPRKKLAQGFVGR